MEATQEPIEKPTEESTQKPAEEPIEEPTQEPIEEPAEESTLKVDPETLRILADLWRKIALSLQQNERELCFNLMSFCRAFYPSMDISALEEFITALERWSGNYLSGKINICDLIKDTKVCDGMFVSTLTHNLKTNGLYGCPDSTAMYMFRAMRGFEAFMLNFFEQIGIPAFETLAEMVLAKNELDFFENELDFV